MSTRSVIASGGERLERVEVMGSPVHQQYQRIVALLRMELGEGELNLLACPVVDENGEPVSWKARSGRALTPVSELSEAERERLEAARDATLAKIAEMIERLKSRGAPGMVTAQVLTAAITLPADGGALYSDGLGPVLADWGSRDRGASPVDQAGVPVDRPAGDSDDGEADQDEVAGETGSGSEEAGISGTLPDSRGEEPRPPFWMPESDTEWGGTERPEPQAEDDNHRRHRLQIHKIEPLSGEETPSEPVPAETDPAAPVEDVTAATDMPRFLPLGGEEDAPASGSGEDDAGAKTEARADPDERAAELADEPVPVMPARRRRLFARASRFSGKKPPWPASPPLVAESDEAFLRRQRREGRVISADPLPKKSPVRPHRREPEGNALVWLVPAFIVGGITFYLSQSPAALERLLARLPEPVARQFRPDMTLPAPLPNATSTPAPTPAAGIGDRRSLVERLAQCFDSPADAGDALVTLSAIIDADGRLAETAIVDESTAGPLSAAAIAAVNRCQPFVGVKGPARLTVTFGPGGPEFVQVEAVTQPLPR